MSATGGHRRGAAEVGEGSPRGPAAAPALARCDICGAEFIPEAFFGHVWTEHLQHRLGKSELLGDVLKRAFEKMRKAGVAP